MISFPVALGLLLQATWAVPFNSAELKRTLATQCSGTKKCLFYFWSPHMPLSIDSRAAALRFARAKNMTVITLLDPTARTDLASMIRKKEAWDSNSLRIAEAPELIKLGIRIHYPSYIIATRGRLGGPLIPGARTEEELHTLSQRFWR